jgi:hypothetical protein
MASRPSEYGGRGGLIQRQADGHTPTVGEEAQLMRAAGLRDAAGDLNKQGSGPTATFPGWTPELVRADYDAAGDRNDV